MTENEERARIADRATSRRRTVHKCADRMRLVHPALGDALEYLGNINLEDPNPEWEDIPNAIECILEAGIAWEREQEEDLELSKLDEQQEEKLGDAVRYMTFAVWTAFILLCTTVGLAVEVFQ